MTSAGLDTSTDQVPAVQTSTLTFTTYGEGAWGSSPWGDPHAVTRRLSPVPNGACAQLSVGLRVREAGAFFQLAGLVLESASGGGPGQR